MQLRKLLSTEERAVSPVIGVILMVAITVILAAVIASFVLGLGGEQEVAPSHTFTFDYDSDRGGADAGALTIRSQGGDPVRVDELYVRGDGFCGASGASCGTFSTTPNMMNAGNWTAAQASGNVDETTAVAAGDTLSVGVESDYSFSVVWESTDSSSSSELASHEGPDA